MHRPVWISPSGIEWSQPQATGQITAGSTWYFQTLVPGPGRRRPERQPLQRFGCDLLPMTGMVPA